MQNNLELSSIYLKYLKRNHHNLKTMNWILN
nr:MAG TPA: hypothetical protein [Caudoviricetes sp.]